MVKEGDTLELGTHKSHFCDGTSMVHWPEVMVEYEETEKNPFLCRRIWKIRCAERRRRVDRRGEKILYQYRWKIRCAGSDTAQKKRRH